MALLHLKCRVRGGEGCVRGQHFHISKRKLVFIFLNSVKLEKLYDLKENRNDEEKWKKRKKKKKMRL